jgi:hypothetical protein
VAGIIAANSNNNLGIAGLSANAVILPVKVLNEGGNGTTSSVAAGLIWATDNGARIANLSLSGPNDTVTMRQAVEYATSRGVLVVVSAGNSGVDSPILYPASYDNVIAVAASDQTRTVASFSSRGSYVDVTAPGRSIASTAGTTGYVYMSGTSMAAPHVVAQAAVLAGLYPQSTATEIRSYIETTLVDIDQPGRDVSSGGGLIDIAASIQAASGVVVAPEATPSDPPPAPSGTGTAPADVPGVEPIAAPVAPPAPESAPVAAPEAAPADAPEPSAPEAAPAEVPEAAPVVTPSPLPAVASLRVTLQGSYVALQALMLSGSDVEGYRITRDGKLLGVFPSPKHLDKDIWASGSRTYEVRAVSRIGMLGDAARAVITPAALRQPTIRSATAGRRSIAVVLGPVARGQRVYVYLSGKLAYSSPPSPRAQTRMIVRLGRLTPGKKTLQVQLGTTGALSKLSRTRMMTIKR